VSKLAGMLGLAAAGAAVLAYDRAKRIAEDEGRPLGEVLAEMPGKLFADLRTLIAALPDQTVLLDLPLPAGCWGFLGRASVPYVTRINRTIHQAAAARGLPVAEVSAHFLPPWSGKFASDRFHPSQDGYRDWARAILATVPPLAAAA
jgi:hypothetical protein